MAASKHKLGIVWFDGELAVCRLGPHARMPGWIANGKAGFVAVTRTPDELSVICEATLVPARVRCIRGWRLGRIAGALPHDAVGVLASVAGPLADAGVSLFACATFDTDWLLVQDAQLSSATAALRGAGHTVRMASRPRTGRSTGFRSSGARTR